MSDTLPPGWGFPTAVAKKAHYFPEGESRSLCGRYGRFVGLRVEDFDHASPDNCLACGRRRSASTDAGGGR